MVWGVSNVWIIYAMYQGYRTVPLRNDLDIFEKSTRDSGKLLKIYMDELKEHFPKAFKENPLEFFVGATDVDTGEPRYHKCFDGGDTDLLWLRASASMPLVSRPVEVDGYRLLDGGVVDAIPYHFLVEQGYDRNVVVLTQPKGYRKKKTSFFLLFALRKTPKIKEKMAKRSQMYNEEVAEIERLEEEGKIFVVRPPESLGISRTESNPDELERVYQIGRAEALKHLEDIKKFLNK